MKKNIILAVLFFSMPILLAGCGGAGNNSFVQENEKKSQVSEKEQPDETYDAEEPAGFDTPYMIEGEKDGYFIVSKLDGALYGLLDCTGKEVVKVEYDSISFPESKNANAIIVEMEGKYGLYSYGGEEILPVEYESVIDSGENSELYLVQSNGKQKIVDLSGKTIYELSGIYDRLVGDRFLTMKYQGYPNYFTEVYNLNEEVLFSDGDVKNTGIAFEIKNAKNMIGIYNPGYEDVWGDEKRDSGIVLKDEKWNTVLSYNFPYDDWTEFQYISPYALGDDGKWLALYYPRSVYGNNLVLYNIDTQEFTGENYNQFVNIDEENFFGIHLDTDTHVYTIDIFNINGEITASLESVQAQNIPALEGNSMIICQAGNTYRIYDKNGETLTDERYLSAELTDGFAIVENLDGEYGIVDKKGKMRIPFGEIEKGKRYKGKEWEDIYEINDLLYLVVRDGEGCTISVF